MGFAQIDRNGDNSINVNEFLDWYLPLYETMPKKDPNEVK